jgi:hypothetical protein
MNNSGMVIGLDLGGTIFHNNQLKEKVPMPDAFNVIKEFLTLKVPVYVVSRVNDDQSLKAYGWFRTFQFFENTGLTPNKVYFCYERHEKGPICQRLGVTHFVDDRPEVMMHMPVGVKKYLMNPTSFDLDKHGLQDSHPVTNWNEVRSLLFYDWKNS